MIGITAGEIKYETTKGKDPGGSDGYAVNSTVSRRRGIFLWWNEPRIRCIAEVGDRECDNIECKKWRRYKRSID